MLVTYPVCLPTLPLTELPASFLVGWKVGTCCICHRCRRRRMSKTEGKSAKFGTMLPGEAVSGKKTDNVANDANAMLPEWCKQTSGFLKSHSRLQKIIRQTPIHPRSMIILPIPDKSVPTAHSSYSDNSASAQHLQ